jgi:hypothetical protein
MIDSKLNQVSQSSTEALFDNCLRAVRRKIFQHRHVLKTKRYILFQVENKKNAKYFKNQKNVTQMTLKTKKIFFLKVE